MLNIVLYQPEIPQNTGNIIRTCVALNAKLHLIRPYGFILSDKTLRRSGVDYVDLINYEEYNTWEDFITKNKEANMFFLTRYATTTYSDANFKDIDNVYLVFGKESTGIPHDILRDNVKNCLRMPMSENVRSINLANTVAIMGYEVMRQKDFKSLSKFEIQKGKDFLTK